MEQPRSPGLSKAQAKELLEGIEMGTLLGLRDQAMLSLMLRTGIRRMDAIGATVGALSERDGHTVLRVIGKRNKERIVKIPVCDGNNASSTSRGMSFAMSLRQTWQRWPATWKVASLYIAEKARRLSETPFPSLWRRHLKSITGSVS